MNIPKLAMEAKKQYYKRYGSSIGNYLAVSSERFAKTSKVLSKPINIIAKSNIVKKTTELITGLSASREFMTPSRFSFMDLNKEEGYGNKTALFFVGCYYNYFEPEIGLATINLLKKVGFKIIIPDQNCCGIPAMTKGMIDKALNLVDVNLKKMG